MAKDITTYDKQNLYNEEIESLVQELLVKCEANKLPVFVSVATVSTAENTRYTSHSVGAASMDVNLKNDILPKFVKVAFGADVVLPVGETDVSLSSDETFEL